MCINIIFFLNGHIFEYDPNVFAIEIIAMSYRYTSFYTGFWKNITGIALQSTTLWPNEKIAQLLEKDCMNHWFLYINFTNHVIKIVPSFILNQSFKVHNYVFGCILVQTHMISSIGCPSYTSLIVRYSRYAQRKRRSDSVWISAMIFNMKVRICKFKRF